MYYDKFKENFKKDIDIVSISKKFLGSLYNYFVIENDYNVSSNESLYKIDDDYYLVTLDDKHLIAKINGVCSYIEKGVNGYTIEIISDNIKVRYEEVLSVDIKLYDYILSGDVVGELNCNQVYYYKVKYEN